ncbi:hypothetical protein K227x_40510 [Rubripirellula lacrimiformis]|uniref:Uncharacterized protein n=1 Tax=Rubripirellula lacrimiformis TaxID=1930273 RepID=A0A517NEU9_9BACT|nr:hypothetical protein K227x_40510 [Rubripirellula lacrimiformis]
MAVFAICRQRTLLDGQSGPSRAQSRSDWETADLQRGIVRCPPGSESRAKAVTVQCW